MTPIIEVNDVCKIYPSRRGIRTLVGRGGLGDWLRRRNTTTFNALNHVTLNVQPGESIGIIGRNGSGKSTLLKILAGVTLPTTGNVIVRGRVASLLELGAGFAPVLTGRENIYLNAGLLGMRHRQVDAVIEDIIEFSGIRDFVDQPVDTYSSGMFVRLAFSVAIHTSPDIFLADEVLAVGDEEFQRKCRRKIGELREQGKTILFVSHDLGVINALCERVVLLNKGKVLLRETPQKTIMYYLRQVGREAGVHTYRDGDVEAIFCDGRISLYRQGEEFTSPIGVHANVQSLGSWHASPTSADWTALHRRENGCTAEGQMARMPAKWVWEQSIVDGAWQMTVSLVCERELSIQRIEVCLALSSEYAHWIYGDHDAPFPAIMPQDLQWDVLAAPEKSVQHVAALPTPASPLPPVDISVDLHDTRLFTLWANSDYNQYSRLFVVAGNFPENGGLFPPGAHRLFSWRLDTAQSAETIRTQMKAERTLRCGRMELFFEHGYINVAADGIALTAPPHFYTSMLIEGLWHNSHSLQWTGAIEADGSLRMTGESRRFPLRQHWRITPKHNAASVLIHLEVTEPLRVEEYHASIGLTAAYTNWSTDHESGVFAEITPQADIWKHMNRSFIPGRHIAATGPNLPRIALDTTPTQDSLPYRMTAINTSHRENARVLQALCASDAGEIRFVPGQYVYFSGVLRMDDA
ncbi:MAG TPA: ABC transporter ATP-binding protein [Candidatus Hydrogenedentes bacterium]|nr:ABC transporter ATP-binding protein [Candidatus Hydrogenedentota bacterium]HOS01818.1 ABC transporter ATP-binding protein [Candidatus Hydrogenedentota bacterium]